MSSQSPPSTSCHHTEEVHILHVTQELLRPGPGDLMECPHLPHAPHIPAPFRPVLPQSAIPCLLQGSHTRCSLLPLPSPTPSAQLGGHPSREVGSMWRCHSRGCVWSPGAGYTFREALLTSLSPSPRARGFRAGDGGPLGDRLWLPLCQRLHVRASGPFSRSSEDTVAALQTLLLLPRPLASVSGLSGGVCLQPLHGSLGPALVSGPRGPAQPGAGLTAGLTRLPRPPPTAHASETGVRGFPVGLGGPLHHANPQSNSALLGGRDRDPDPSMEAGGPPRRPL